VNANYGGSPNYDSRYYSSEIQIYVTNPITLQPGGTLSLSYPYFFNATGSLTLEPERIIYSSQVNITGTDQPLIGEYVAQSNNVGGVNVGPATILPVASATMNATKLSVFYIAENQTNVRINLSVTNTGPQTASNVVVTALIPRPSYNYYYGPGRWLPVVDHGTVTSIDNFQGTVSFSAGTLQPGQVASAWYVVKMNTTGLFTTYSNVTAQGPTGTKFKFTYSGSLLAGYPAFTKPTTLQPGIPFSLQTSITTAPSVIANGTQTTVTLHLYNEGNTTLTSISATLYGYNYTGYSPLTFAPASVPIPDMPPWSSQTVTFTATDHTNNALSWITQPGVINARVTYNHGSSPPSDQSYSNSNVLVYNRKIPGFNPSVRVDVSVGQSTVPAGSAVVAVLAITNTGSSNVTNVQLSIGSWPELTYGTLNPRWDGIIKPGQTVKFRLGIQTRPGILYPVLVSNMYYSYYLPGSTVPYNSPNISASSAAQIIATDTNGPTIGAPWTSPFATTPTDHENVWAMMSDPSAIGGANLDYSTNNKQTWTTIPMTSMVATYSGSGAALVGQSLAGDIFNATIPAQPNGTIVFYRIRATDFLGNPTTQDNNGNLYSYTVLGFNPTQGTTSVIVPVPAGNNVPVNVAQYIPTVKATITLNLTTPVELKLTQLSSAGASSIGAPTAPAGHSSLGIYLQIQTAIPITGISAVIRIYYNSTQIQGLNASTIVPYHWETGTSSWVPLDNVQRNTAEMWVQGTATHFSLFAIFAASPAPACTSNCTKSPPPAQPPWLIIGIVVAVVVVAAVGGFYRTRMRKRGPSTTESTLTPTPASGTPTSPGAEPGPSA
jgi:hypothetical protein